MFAFISTSCVIRIKLKVYFERQIPIWRNIDRLNNIDQNNKYYKLGENMLSIIPAKDIAEWIME